MFIPAENVYYEVIVRDESFGDEGSLLAYAAERRVVPVSPNSFFAYLSTVVTGLKGCRSRRGAEILDELGRLRAVRAVRRCVPVGRQASGSARGSTGSREAGRPRR
jgi:DNA anti-recombination protein RmuC